MIEFLMSTSTGVASIILRVLLEKWIENSTIWCIRIDFSLHFVFGILILSFPFIRWFREPLLYQRLDTLNLLSFIVLGKGHGRDGDRTWGFTEFTIPWYFSHSLHTSFLTYLGPLNLSLRNYKVKISLFL